MNTERQFGWHFVGDTLRDGRPIPADGEWLEHDGQLVMCERGLHWSKTPWKALVYAPGATLCYVEIRGKTLFDDDKACSCQRKIIGRRDINNLLWRFARQQALSVINKWDAPEIVREYLMTGDENLRSAARSAAESAAWSAAWSSALSAAWSATAEQFNTLIMQEFEEVIRNA